MLKKKSRKKYKIKLLNAFWKTHSTIEKFDNKSEVLCRPLHRKYKITRDKTQKGTEISEYDEKLE